MRLVRVVLSVAAGRGALGGGLWQAGDGGREGDVIGGEGVCRSGRGRYGRRKKGCAKAAGRVGSAEEGGLAAGRGLRQPVGVQREEWAREG